MIVLIIALVRVSGIAYNYGREIFNQSAMASEGNGVDITVTILEGESVSEFAADLEKYGLIADTTLFKLQEYFSEYHGLEQAGTYTLNTEMTPDEILETVSSGSDGSDE